MAFRMQQKDSQASLMKREMTRGVFLSIGLLLALCLIVMASLAQAAPPTTLTVCALNRPPYSEAPAPIVDEETTERPAQGLSVAIFRTVAKKANFALTFALKPYQDCLTGMKNGQFDVFLDLPRDIAEDNGFLIGQNSFSASYMAFWVRKDHPALFYDPTATKWQDVLIGVVGGYRYSLPFKANLMPSADDLTNFQLLAKGQREAILAEAVRGALLVQEQKWPVRALSPAVQDIALFPAFRTGRKAEAQSFDRLLGQLLKEGVIDRLYEEHVWKSFSDLKKLYQTEASGP